MCVVLGSVRARGSEEAACSCRRTGKLRLATARISCEARPGFEVGEGQGRHSRSGEANTRLQLSLVRVYGSDVAIATSTRRDATQQGKRSRQRQATTCTDPAPERNRQRVVRRLPASPPVL